MRCLSVMRSGCDVHDRCSCTMWQCRMMCEALLGMFPDRACGATPLITGRGAPPARICASTELQHWPRPHAAGVYSHAYGIRAVAPSTARMLARACISPILASSILPPTVSASALSRGVARQSIAMHVAIRRRAMQCTRGLPHATCNRRHAACNRRLGRNRWLSRPIAMAAPRWL